jgi:cation:H+ antiporter
MTQFLLNLVYFLAGMAGLYYGAEFLIKGGVTIARKIGISSLVIGLTLVAFATSAPELVVSVSAGLDGKPDIALGNVIGSNICNIALILGLCGCIAPLSVEKKLFRFDLPVLVISSLVLTFFCFKGAVIGFWHGALLFAGLIFYTSWSIYASRKENSSTEENSGETPEKEKSLPRALFFTALGLGLLVVGAKLFLWSAVYAAGLLKLSEAVIGLTVVAVGTSLPELATSVVAAIRKEQDIAIGNVIGSNIFNVLAILGIAPLIKPIKAIGISVVDIALMIVLSMLLAVFMRSGFKISRREGAIMLAVYIAYTAYLIVK